MNERKRLAGAPWRFTGRRLAWFWLALPALGWLEPGCLERRDPPPSAEWEVTRCASCHGDASRPGDFLLRAAPPVDLMRDTAIGSPGVGAHSIHLYGSETHAPIECAECHQIPETVDAPGHADSARPAELVFGGLARTGGRRPVYDPAARSCSDTWCHRSGDAVWTEPKSADLACGSCHGLPPPAPHPQSERCSVCHAQVVDAERRIIAPALHVDGRVQYSADECSQCHGEGDDPAPPLDTRGNSSVEAIGVGAHRTHLSGGSWSRPLECTECHRVPERVEDPGHADGLPAEVELSGISNTEQNAPAWDRDRAACSNTWCHAPRAAGDEPAPTWTSVTALSCASCHGLPPPLPHPQSDQCASCHGEIVGADQRTILEPTRHVDGIVDVAVEPDCTSCHGDANAAPPRDVTGNQEPAAAGVGAHQTHVLGTPSSRAVACTTCHRVPTSVLEDGHIDSELPAEVALIGPAATFGGVPEYVDGSCANTSCHGAVFAHGHDSGGSLTAPKWNVVDGTQAACGTCHGLPPPRPHPYVERSPDCSSCHENLARDNVTFTRPDLHVDGQVTFTVP